MGVCPSGDAHFTESVYDQKTAQASLRLKTKVWIPKKRQSTFRRSQAVLFGVCGRARPIRSRNTNVPNPRPSISRFLGRTRFSTNRLHPTLAVLRSPVRAVSSQAVAGAPCWPCHFRELPARALLGWSVRPQEALCHQFRRANSWASTGRLGTVRYRANAKECSPRGARTRLDRYTAR
jgi:hypothetical protein